MDSLSPECTPLKHKYDSCFNSWFEGYLQPVMAVAAAEPPAEEINANDAKSDQTSTTSTTSDADGTSPPINAKDADTLSLSSSTSSTTKKLRFPRTRRILTVLFGSANKPRHLSLREQGDMDHPDLWGHESGGGRELVAPGSGSLGGLLGRQGRDGESNLASSSSSSGSKSPFDSSSQTDDEDEEEESDGPEELDDFDISHSEQTKDLDNDIGEEMSPIVERVKPAEITVQERAREKAEEYERNCGELFRDYRSCLQRAINANPPLAGLLDQSRIENPMEEGRPLSGGGFGAEGAEP